jgi:putative cell wall-binding protein
MKKYRIGIFILMFFVIGILDTKVQASEKVIEHPNLEEAIKFQIGIDSKVTLSEQQLQELSSLDASWWGVGSLAGLEKVTNLTSLYLDGNGLNNIQTLQKLNQLNTVVLSDNNISDISALKNYQQLSLLDVSHNNLKDVSALSSISFIGTDGGLSLADNQISDLSPLLNTTFPKDSQYFFIDISGNRLSNLNGLENVTNLTELSAANNSLNEISSLADLENIRFLDIANNKVTNLKPLQNNQLEVLKAANNTIKTLDGLQISKTDSLYIEMQGNELEDISNLSGVTEGYINLEDNQIKDISPLKEMKSGTVLLQGNPLNGNAAEIIYSLEQRGVKVTHDSLEIPTMDEKRLAGSNRYDTAVKISKKGWPTTSPKVVLARGDSFPDALAGVPLAYKLDAPILLTDQDKLPVETRKEISRLRADEVTILGGTGAISKKVEKELKDLDLTIKRIAGSDRFDTARKIAVEMGGNPDKAVVAYGYNFPDALAIASYAAQNNYPILLTGSSKLPSTTKSFLKNIEETIIVGGESVIGKEIEKELHDWTRIGGSNRFDTAAKMITELGMSTDQVFIGNGYGFADSLTGSVLAAKHNSPLLLVNYDNIPSDTERIFNQYSVYNITALGGRAVIMDEVVFNLTKLQK